MQNKGDLGEYLCIMRDSNDECNQKKLLLLSSPNFKRTGGLDGVDGLKYRHAVPKVATHDEAWIRVQSIREWRIKELRR